MVPPERNILVAPADGKITDNPGFAIDSGHVYAFDYETGNGTEVGLGGDWGIHALGGPLFRDGIPRLYVLSRNAELYLLDPESYELSDILITGPAVNNAQAPAHSGITGPLTNCETGFTPVV